MTALQQTQSSGIHWPAPQRRALLFEGPKTQMANFSVEYDALLSKVRRDYVLPADTSVTNFLNEHRILPPILLEAMPELKACFGAQAVVALRTSSDDSGSQTLYAVALWPGEIGKVREALEKFDDRWWIQHSRNASGYLTFTYELI